MLSYYVTVDVGQCLEWAIINIKFKSVIKYYNYKDVRV